MTHGFPQCQEQGCEIAGFVWWQGHKDGNPAHASRYEQNLVRLIKTPRKEFDVPDAPFVLGTIGFDGWELAVPHRTIANAQLVVSGEKGKYPKFKGNVLTVETRDFWPPVELSPRNQGDHYNRNAETYMLVGEALGRGMVELLDHSMISGLRRGGERDEGHTGNSFNMLWAMPGVALSGRPDLSAQTSPNIMLKEAESRITTEALPTPFPPALP